MNDLLGISTNFDSERKVRFSPDGYELLVSEFGPEGMKAIASVEAAVNEYNNYRAFQAGSNCNNDDLVSMNFSPVDGKIRLRDPLQQLGSYDVFRRMTFDGRKVVDQCEIDGEKGNVSVQIRTYPLPVISESW